MRPGPYTKESGKGGSEMVKGCKLGQMEQNTKENGGRTKHMASESSFILMETYMKETGLTTKPMDMEYTLMPTEQSIKDSGRMICSMVSVLSRGQIHLTTKDGTASAESMALVHISGAMGLSIPVSGTKTRFKESEFTSGSTADAMRANGLRIIWKALESIFGATEGFI